MSILGIDRGEEAKAIGVLAEFVRENRERLCGPNPYPAEVFERDPPDPEAVVSSVIEVLDSFLPVAEQIHNEACKRSMEDLAGGITKHFGPSVPLRGPEPGFDVDPEVVVSHTMMLLRQIADLKELRHSLFSLIRRIALALRKQHEDADECFDKKGNVLVPYTLARVLELVESSKCEQWNGPLIPWNTRGPNLYNLVAEWWLKRLEEGAKCKASVYITEAHSQGRHLAQHELAQVPRFDVLLAAMKTFQGKQGLRWTLRVDGSDAPDVRDVTDVVTFSDNS